MMKRLFISTIAVIFLLKFLTLTDIPLIPHHTQAAESDIWTQMRENTGYVVLLRHAKTEPGTGDPPGFKLDDCATQRNLSEAGREQAKKIGKEFRKRNIPVIQVLSSQYCRCLETAELLNLGTVKSLPMLNSIFEDRSTATQQVEQTRQQILDHLNNSGVIVMVSHYANIVEVSNAFPQEGAAIVVRADGQGEVKVVATLKDW